MSREGKIPRARGRWRIFSKAFEQSSVRKRAYLIHINPAKVMQGKQGKRLEAGKSVREIRVDFFHRVN